MEAEGNTVSAEGDADAESEVDNGAESETGTEGGQRVCESPFEPAVELQVGAFPDSSTAFDMDGDGDLDIAALSEEEFPLSIWENLGGGVFAAEPKQLLRAARRPGTVVSGDVNEDGLVDLLVLNSAGHVDFEHLGTGPLYIYFGSGEAFELGAVVDSIWGPEDSGIGAEVVRLADLDQDGHLDVVYQSLSAPRLPIGWRYGDGKGGFSEVSTITSALGSRAMAVGDLDGDDMPDLAMAGAWGASVHRGLGGRDGFDPEGRELFLGTDSEEADGGPGYELYEMVLADENGDGLDDVLMVGREAPTRKEFRETGYLGRAVLIVWHSSDEGFFESEPIEVTLPDTRSQGGGVHVVDVNGDGHRDLVMLSAANSDNGDGGMDIAFGPYDLKSPDWSWSRDEGWDSPLFPRMADLNNDGVLDLFAANKTGGNLRIEFGCIDSEG